MTFLLLRLFSLDKNEYNDLCNVCNIYLWESLKHSFPKKQYSLNNKIFYDHLEDILKLPNRTPNGMIVPYFENFKSYNLIHDTLSTILEKNGFIDHFSEIQSTFKIRVISNKIKGKAVNRETSSFKIHTDIWSSEPISHLLINIPILGNSKEIGINFFHPEQDLSGFNMSLDNYGKAENLLKKIKPYKMLFNKGLMFFSDAYALHQTFVSQKIARKKIDGRLSIDIRVIFKNLLPNEKKTKNRKTPENYIPINQWKKFSRNQILVNRWRIDSFIKKKEKKQTKKENIEIKFCEYSKG